MRYVILELPQREVPKMMAALHRLQGESGFKEPGGRGAVSGTNCTVTEVDKGQGNMDFECGDT